MRRLLGEAISRRAPLVCALAVLAFALRLEGQPLLPADFLATAEQGFGDLQNSVPWSMQWWRGHLFVGTGRASFCATAATTERFYRFLDAYPPRNPNVECAPAPEDLPLAAEIWRWTPETDTWDLVYRSPVDVALPNAPGRYVAESIGFRGMTLFTEPDGVEALYVGGVSARSLFGPSLPPPRILRSTDGEAFEPLAQVPGTFLGDLPAVGFRTLTSYGGRLYAIASSGLLGHGVLVEAADPAAGNDSFHQVSPEGLTFFEMEPYNGALYLGTGVQALNDAAPYSVLRTTASGVPPYELTTVVEEAAYLKAGSHPAVISMHVFGGALYVGTDRELLRIHADDTWELIVGRARETPVGPKHPLSGLDLSFDHLPNIHVWRMVTHEGWLYVGTQDQSAQWLHLPILDDLLAPNAGFDLYASPNGEDFSVVTRDGLGDPFTTGIRAFSDTPHGLVVGGANAYRGLKLWRGVATTPRTAMPANVDVDLSEGEVHLTWEAEAEAVKFHVYRSIPFRPFRPFRSLLRDEASLGDGIFRFTHYRPPLNRKALYYVVAEDAFGNLSPPSSVVRVPVLTPPATFASVAESLSLRGAPAGTTRQLARARRFAERGDLVSSLRRLHELSARLGSQTPLAAAVARLSRRTALVDAGLLPAERLFRD